MTFLRVYFSSDLLRISQWLFKFTRKRRSGTFGSVNVNQSLTDNTLKKKMKFRRNFKRRLNYVSRTPIIVSVETYARKRFLVKFTAFIIRFVVRTDDRTGSCPYALKNIIFFVLPRANPSNSPTIGVYTYGI